MSQALYRKWRPAVFSDVIGQEHITRTLRNSVAAGRVGHAYLFCGPRGTGKTTLARLLAKAVNCLDEDPMLRPCNRCRICQAVNEGRLLDLIEIDAASNTGVDDIRDLRDKISFSPGEGRFKVYIIDEVHMLSAAAFNALLKTLEEPPPHAKFILATTEEHKVPLTIKSRCQQFNFRLLSLPEISGRLAWIIEQEGLDIEPAALQLIARHGAGSLRDSESLLDQLITTPGDTITLERTQMVLGTASDAVVGDLTTAWLESDGATGLKLIYEALSSGVDARQFCRQMVSYLRQLLLLQAAGSDLPIDAPREQRAEMLAQAQRAERDRLVAAIRTFSEAALAPTTSWQPQLPLELAFIELLPAGLPVVAPPLHSPAAPHQVVAAPPTLSPPEPLPSLDLEEDQSLPPEEDALPEAVADSLSFAGAKRMALEAVEEVAAQPTERVAVEAPAAAPALTLDLFRKHWPAMVQRLERRDRNLPPLLAMCKPLAVEGNTLFLGFQFPQLKEKFERRPEVIGYMAEAYQALIGVECRIRCVLNEQYQPGLAGLAASAGSPGGAAKTVANEREAFLALADELGGTVQES